MYKLSLPGTSYMYSVLARSHCQGFTLSLSLSLSSIPMHQRSPCTTQLNHLTPHLTPLTTVTPSLPCLTRDGRSSTTLTLPPPSRSQACPHPSTTLTSSLLHHRHILTPPPPSLLSCTLTPSPPSFLLSPVMTHMTCGRALSSIEAITSYTIHKEDVETT